MTPLHRLALMIVYADFAHRVSRLQARGYAAGPVTMRIYSALHQLLHEAA